MRDQPARAALHITKINGSYLFQLGWSRTQPLMREIRHTVPGHIRSELLDRFKHMIEAEVRAKHRSLLPQKEESPRPSPEPQSLRLKELSRDISRLLIPAEIVGDLAQLEGVSLVIHTNDPSVPWEVAQVGGTFLSRLVSVGRVVPVSERIIRPATLAPARTARILVLANPTGDLPGADEECRRLRTLFNRRAHIDADFLVGADVNLRNIAALADAHQYHMVHYSGHSDFDYESGEGHIQLAEGPVAASYFVSVFGPGGGPIFFFNSCSSSMIGGFDLPPARVNGIVGSFLSAGAKAFIGATWPVLDNAAVALAADFYTDLSEGFSLGASLNRARLRSGERDNDLTWLGYSLAGDPDLTLVHREETRAGRPVSDGHMATRLLWTEARAATICGLHPAYAATTRKQLVPLLIAAECEDSQKLLVGMESSATNLEELCGSCIGFPPVTGMEFFFLHMLQEAGLAPGDFDLVHLQQDEILSALRRGRIDAAVVWEPYLTAMCLEGFGQIGTAGKGFTDYTVCPLSIARDMESDDETQAALLRAYASCIDYMRTHPEKTVDLLSTFFSISPNVIEIALGKFRFFSVDELSDPTVQTRLAGYIRSEEAFLAERSPPIAAEVSTLHHLVWKPNSRLSSSLSAFDAQIPVAVQNSISNAPLIVGRHLGLFS